MRIMIPMPVPRRATLFDLTDASPSRENSQNPPKDTKNIVVFGETGVGKSSLINLIAGQTVSATSSAAAGCTLECRRYLVTLDEQRYAIWDTAGLDEGTQGSVPAEKAEAYLKQLIQDLAKSSGIDLLVYCVRGTRVRSALLTNYHIFYSAICRRKVPIAIAITGLENEEGDMETWWMKNEPQFTALKMSFDNHACVTTIESFIENPTLKERRDASRTAVIKMITSACRTQQWKPAERSWVESACSDIRAMLSSRDGHDTPHANVIMCDVSRSYPDTGDIRKRTISFHNPVALSFSLNPVTFRSPVSISSDKSIYLPFDESIKGILERLFRVYQVPRKQKPLEGSDRDAKPVTVVKRGADLLIFCVESGEESVDVKSQWEHFSTTYGGDLSPQIVVVVGVSDERSAEEWWTRAVGRAHVKHDAHVAYWPAVQEEGARQRLRYLISECCIDCSKVSVKRARVESIFRRSLRLDVANLTTLWSRPECNAKDDSSSSELDLLTRWDIWDHISSPEQSPASSCRLKD